MIVIIAYVALGVLAGCLSGFLGIGGGLVTIPILAEIFRLTGVPQAHLMQTAIATSVAVMIFTTIGATYAHYRQGNIQWPLLCEFLPGLIIGVMTGVIIANRLPNLSLQILFIILMTVMGIKILMAQNLLSSKNERRPLPKSVAALLIGLLAGLLGIGGGILTVPYLLRLRLPFIQAAALGVAFSFSAAVAGTMSWYIVGKFFPNSSDAFNAGYINWLAMIVVAGSGIIAAYFASKYSEKIPVPVLRTGFGVILLLFALQKSLMLLFN